MTIKNEHNIKIICGHYGSGKTEFSINLALKLKEKYEKVAVVDLDVLNMYFRIREQEDFLVSKKIEVYSSLLGSKSTLDIPAVDPSILKPLQDESFKTVVDIGGNPAGLKALARYKNILDTKGYDQYLVINRNRPETSNFEDVASFIENMEATSQTKITGLINTTHMLKDTSVEDVLYGQELLEEVSKKLNIPIKYIACKRDIAKKLKEKHNIKYEIFPMDLYFRNRWMV